MEPPETCPKCGSANVHPRVSDRFPREWMFLCGDCLFNCAFGEHAMQDAEMVADKMKAPFRPVDWAKANRN